MNNKVKTIKNVTGVALALLALLALAAGPAQAKSYEAKRQANILIIGDRVVDIAYNLGVLPAGMSVRCSLWPMCAKIKVAAQPLGCPGCLAGAKKGKLGKFIKAKGIKLALVEKSSPYCLFKPKTNPLDSVEYLQKQGVQVKIVDFSKGIVPAINQTAAILDRLQQGKALVVKYQKNVKRLEKKIAGKKLNKKVVVLHGTYQAQTGKAFIQVEAPGGYTDQYILTPLGCRNVGSALVPKGRKPTKGRWTIRKLKGLASAKPDVIVLTGDSAAIQKALAAAIAGQAALCGVPVFSLPAYIDSSVIERPLIVGKWAWALE